MKFFILSCLFTENGQIQHFIAVSFLRIEFGGVHIQRGKHIFKKSGAYPP